MRRGDERSREGVGFICRNERSRVATCLILGRLCAVFGIAGAGKYDILSGMRPRRKPPLMRKLTSVVIRVGIVAVKGFIVLAVLVLLLLWSMSQEAKRLSVFFDCHDISELRTKCGDGIKREERIWKDGEFYTVVYLEVSESFIWLPSGPPAMVFNCLGEKVAVCADSGDSPSFHDEWCRGRKHE